MASFWLFDHGSCHATMPDYTLSASKMNVNSGETKRVMRNGWDGKTQKMNYALEIPKGL